MITLPRIWKNILIFLGFANEEPPPEQDESQKYFTEYNDKHGINLTYIAANKTANIVTTDSQINIESSGDTLRAEFLQACADKVWKYKKRIVSRAAGYGKVCLFPYSDNGKTIKYNCIPQSNVILLADDGEKAVDVAVLCEIKTLKTQKFGRFKRYTLDNDSNHTITEFFANLTTNTIIGDTPPLDTGWTALAPFTIANVDRLLFGEIDCPVDNRNGNIFYSARITEGCDDIIKDIKEQFKYLANEYDLKKAFIGADSTLFNRDSNGDYMLPNSQLFRIMDTGVDDFFSVFDPAIRADPIFLRLKNSFEILENHIGLSRGIYTSPENVGAYNNQSNIKRSIFDTYAFVTDFRDNVKRGITDYLYACNVLAEHFGITPQGVDFNNISVNINWSSAMIEDSSEEFNQFAEGYAQQIISGAEFRQWITGESIEEAQSKIDEISLQSADTPKDEFEV